MNAKTTLCLLFRLGIAIIKAVISAIPILLFGKSLITITASIIAFVALSIVEETFIADKKDPNNLAELGKGMAQTNEMQKMSSDNQKPRKHDVRLRKNLLFKNLRKTYIRKKITANKNRRQKRLRRLRRKSTVI